MIRQIDDPAIINGFANHPDIAPAIGEGLDFTWAMRETAVFLFGEHGGLCFEWCAPGTYEVHIMLTKAGRGRWGFDAAKQALAMLNAERVWARVDPDNRPLIYFTRKAGFQHVGRKVLYVGNTPASWLIFEWRNVCPLQS